MAMASQPLMAMVPVVCHMCFMLPSATRAATRSTAVGARATRDRTGTCTANTSATRPSTAVAATFLACCTWRAASFAAWGAPPPSSWRTF
jgi:hypothetical protein